MARWGNISASASGLRLVVSQSGGAQGAGEASEVCGQGHQLGRGELRLSSLRGRWWVRQAAALGIPGEQSLGEVQALM